MKNIWPHHRAKISTFDMLIQATMPVWYHNRTIKTARLGVVTLLCTRMIKKETKQPWKRIIFFFFLLYYYLINYCFRVCCQRRISPYFLNFKKGKKVYRSIVIHTASTLSLFMVTTVCIFLNPLLYLLLNNNSRAKEADEKDLGKQSFAIITTLFIDVAEERKQKLDGLEYNGNKQKKNN